MMSALRFLVRLTLAILGKKKKPVGSSYPLR